jgi:hypothetical protein
MKYVLLKMFVFYQQYLWALTKFLEILYVWMVVDFICSKEVKLG